MSAKSISQSAFEKLAVLGIVFLAAPKLMQMLKPVRDKLTPGAPTTPTIPDVLGLYGPQIDTGSVKTTLQAEQPIEKIADGKAPTGVAPMPANPDELAPVSGPLGGLFLQSIALLFLVTGLSFAAPRSVTYKSAIGPATSTSNVTIASATVPSGTTARNAITNITVSASGGILTILSGVTTTYAVDLPTGTFTNYWGPDDPWTAAVSTRTHINVNGSATSFKINYQGYTY